MMQLGRSSIALPNISLEQARPDRSENLMVTRPGRPPRTLCGRQPCTKNAGPYPPHSWDI